MSKKPQVAISIERVRGSILNRIQQINAHVKIWALLELEEHRHPSFSAWANYHDFIVCLPKAMATAFVVNICSLFDLGKDCITLNTYRERIEESKVVPNEIKDLLQETAELVAPLRKVRHAYYAHRLESGMTDDLIGQTGLTYNKIIEIESRVSKCVDALLKFEGVYEYTRLDPVTPLNQLTSDIATIHGH